VLLPAFVLLLPGLMIVPVLVLGAAVVAVRALGWQRRVPGGAVQLVGRVAVVVVVALVATSLVGTIVDVV
jgi:hypothetical protein